MQVPKIWRRRLPIDSSRNQKKIRLISCVIYSPNWHWILVVVRLRDYRYTIMYIQWRIQKMEKGGSDSD